MCINDFTLNELKEIWPLTSNPGNVDRGCWGYIVCYKKKLDCTVRIFANSSDLVFKGS
jgi:hypothetical protein